MYNVIERVVTKQLSEILTTEDLLPDNQSAYLKRHLTETGDDHAACVVGRTGSS